MAATLAPAAAEMAAPTGPVAMARKPAVVIGNKGPGVANLLSGAVHAAKENTPTIYIGGQRHRLYEQRVRRGKMQYLSQPRLFEPAMKYVGVIEYPEQTDEIVREAGEMLAQSGLNYIGFVEGDGIFHADVDVVVTDGFVGNVALKTMEGVARLIALHEVGHALGLEGLVHVLAAQAQVLRGVVRAQIRPVADDRAVLLQSAPQEDLLPGDATEIGRISGNLLTGAVLEPLVITDSAVASITTAAVGAGWIRRSRGPDGALALERQLARLEGKGLVGAEDRPRHGDGFRHVCLLSQPGTPRVWIGRRRGQFPVGGHRVHPGSRQLAADPPMPPCVVWWCSLDAQRAVLGGPPVVQIGCQRRKPILATMVR